jgi:hypothetical protein
MVGICLEVVAFRATAPLAATLLKDIAVRCYQV